MGIGFLVWVSYFLCRPEKLQDYLKNDSRIEIESMREPHPLKIQRLKFTDTCFCLTLLWRDRFLVACLIGASMHCCLPGLADHLGPDKRTDPARSVRAPAATKGSAFEKININRASMQELSSLPGIGEETAKRIVDYRKMNPPFRRIEELLIIRGISKNRLEVIKDRISVK